MTRQIAILGAGPAGLTAARELTRLDPDVRIAVMEADAIVGGIARTESHKGFRFDIGGHRFFTKLPEIEAAWEEIMGDDFITVPRKSRIYYGGKYYDYPLKITNALRNMGPYESAFIMGSFFRWRLFPKKQEDTFEQWVINRFGRRLYRHFFKSYTEKVWGIHCNQINADWAEQRIKNLSLIEVVKNAITGANDSASLIEKFRYPRLGPGQMWEKVTAELVEGGAEVRMNTRVTALRREGDRIAEVEMTGPDGAQTLRPDAVVSTLALRDLIRMMDPPAPAPVAEAAERLAYRDFLIVTLILDDDDPFPDNWIYVHEPGVQVGRIQNFRAWSKEMVPGGKGSSIGMEYFCHEGDGLWEMEDDALIEMAGAELEELGLSKAARVTGGRVIRQPKAYPVYDENYREAVATVSDWLRGIEGFETCGRNGLHRYNNQDHSMLTAILAARNLVGEDHDVWTVNVERSYHETFTTAEREKQAAEARAA